MLFNSLSYAVFLPLVCLVYYALPHRLRWAVLLLFSCYFYMSWDPQLIVLIFFTTAVSWLAGLLLSRLQRPAARKLVLGVGICLCLVVLFFFKYFDFFTGSLNHLFAAIGLRPTLPVLQLILPVGISFYTFQTLSYIVDVYRGDLPAETHFGLYALYVSFFPQLVAGPIERAGRLLPQFRQEHHFSTAACSEGLRKIAIGLFKKVVIADSVAPFVNTVYGSLPLQNAQSMLLATVLFSVQIYCDFSGYSDIAVGSARLLGFDLMENFKSPYFAASIREFWRRWHISLTTWFTDYIYIPLGGSRCGRVRHLCNLVFTFLLSGLWHGAGWPFICWGLYHGLLLCVESFYVKKLDAVQTRLGRSPAGVLLRILRTGCTLILVNVGWVFFRANTIGDALYIVHKLLRELTPQSLTAVLAPMGMQLPQLLLVGLLILALALWDGYSYRYGSAMERLCAARPAVRYLVYWVLGTALLLMLMSRPIGTAADFIYFQF